MYMWYMYTCRFKSNGCPYIIRISANTNVKSSGNFGMIYWQYYCFGRRYIHRFYTVPTHSPCLYHAPKYTHVYGLPRATPWGFLSALCACSSKLPMAHGAQLMLLARRCARSFIRRKSIYLPFAPWPLENYKYTRHRKSALFSSAASFRLRIFKFEETETDWNLRLLAVCRRHCCHINHINYILSSLRLRRVTVRVPRGSPAHSLSLSIRSDPPDLYIDRLLSRNLFIDVCVCVCGVCAFLVFWIFLFFLYLAEKHQIIE